MISSTLQNAIIGASITQSPMGALVGALNGNFQSGPPYTPHYSYETQALALRFFATVFFASLCMESPRLGFAATLIPIGIYHAKMATATTASYRHKACYLPASKDFALRVLAISLACHMMKDATPSQLGLFTVACICNELYQGKRWISDLDIIPRSLVFSLEDYRLDNLPPHERLRLPYNMVRALAHLEFMRSSLHPYKPWNYLGLHITANIPPTERVVSLAAYAVSRYIEIQGFRQTLSSLPFFILSFLYPFREVIGKNVRSCLNFRRARPADPHPRFRDIQLESVFDQTFRDVLQASATPPRGQNAELEELRKRTHEAERQAREATSAIERLESLYKRDPILKKFYLPDLPGITKEPVIDPTCPKDIQDGPFLRRWACQEFRSPFTRQPLAATDIIPLPKSKALIEHCIEHFGEDSDETLQRLLEKANTELENHGLEKIEDPSPKAD